MALGEESAKLHASVALHPGKKPDTHRIGSWVGPRAGLDVFGKQKHLLPLNGIRTPDRLARSIAFIPTTLARLMDIHIY
jgi:hypothetical protein